MSCITQLLELKGDKEILPISRSVVIEGGGKYKDHEYLIVFTDFGHRCGYVALHDNEHKHFKGDDYPDVSCHGGITFYDREHMAKDLLPVKCNDAWIGFDAAHSDDKKCLNTIRKYFGSSEYIDSLEERFATFHAYPYMTHKCFGYMENECKLIIDQLCELKDE